jgi:uncharacterized protein YndB with AHSA1/START domain
MTAPKHVYEVYIRTTPERLWQALTDPAMTQVYYFGSLVESDFTPGSPILYKQADGRLDIEGEVVEADPPRKLVHTFKVGWDPDIAEAPTRVSWEITPMGETCRLSVIHDGFTTESRLYSETGGGWSVILSGLKTLLETGEKLQIGAPEAEATPA